MTWNMTMLKLGLLLVFIVCLVLTPSVNAELVSTDQNISESAELSFTIKDCTFNIVAEMDENVALDGAPDVEKTPRIPGAVKKYELVNFDQPRINTGLRSTSPILSFQIDGVEYPTHLKRMDFESIDDGIDSYSGQLSGVENSSVLLTISDRATIGSITLNDETYYIEPIQPEYQVELVDSIPHIIYSSKDVENREFLIDNGPVNPIDNKPDTTSKSQTSNSGIESVQSMDTVTDGRTTVTILVVTDYEFYSDHSGSGWKVVAQDIIAEANRQFGRDDIGVILIPIYDDSKRQDLSNNPSLKTNPFIAFMTVYPNTTLDTYSADLSLYLGGNDRIGDFGYVQGNSDGYGNSTFQNNGRHSWAQMVWDLLPVPVGYTGTTKGRRVISIHEIGHQFGAHHEDNTDTPGYNRAFTWGGSPPLNLRTVMWTEYSETASTYEFSSSSHMGDATHDNARMIYETKSIVSKYASCAASPPSADFIWAPDSPPAGQMITFTITNPVNNPTYYYWDFGKDGATSTEITPKYAYSEAGTYTAKLTAANCAGSSITEHDITITTSSNHVNFFGWPLIGSAPLKVYLSSEGTTPTPSSYNWSLGDGNYSSDPNPVHTYYENGTYSVTLTIVQEGIPSTKIMQNYITVAPHKPDASFTSFINSGSAPLYIQFNDTSINNPTSWNWNFDDGMMFNTTNPLQKNVSHTFTTARTYNITLAAVNTLGSNTVSQLITATNIPPPTNTDPFEKTSAGLYTYTCPAGVNSITITIVGAGGGGGGGTYDSVSSTGNGGYGGNSSQVKLITQIVSPGSVISVDIGSKGAGGKGQCGQVNGNPGSDGGYSSAGNIIASGGLGGRGGRYSPTTSYWNGYPGQDGYSTGQFATAGSTSGDAIGGAGGIGRGAGGGGASAPCPGVGGNGADGYVKIQPNMALRPLANFTATPRTGPAPLTVQFTDTSTGNPTSWNWNFGDNSTTNATKNPVHTYLTTGSFTVRLNATNVTTGSNITEKINFITVTELPLTISSITPSSGPTKGGTAVTIKGTNFVSGGSFGVKVGGTTATNVSRINATTITAKTLSGTAGAKDVVVTNNDGQTANKTGGFTYIAPPVANFTGTPTSGTAPLTVNFTDSSTNTPDIRKWTFGDGSTTNDTEKNPVHTYINKGTYTVSLNATNSAGSNTSTKTNYINVTAPLKPVANFTGIPTSGDEPLTVIFTDTSTNKPTIWNWSFGDMAWFNTTDPAEKNPVHTYLMAGEYNVSLTASNTAGSNTTTKGGSDTKPTGYISVFLHPPPPPP